MSTFTQRRRNKKSTVVVSKQTVEAALVEGQALAEQWFEANQNDPRIDELQAIMDHLSTILHQSPQELKAEGVSSVEDFFDDSKKPAEAAMIKREVDMIAKWRRTAKPVNSVPMAPAAPSKAVPAMASEKKADGGAAFVNDRDEKGEPKSPEKLEVPRVAKKKKEKEAAPEPAAPVPAPEAAPVVPAPEAAAPAAAPAAPAAAAPAPIPADGTFDIKTLTTEALAKTVKALAGIKGFDMDKSAQALIEQLTAELKTRPVEQKEQKAPAAPAAAAPAPAAAPVAPAPIAASAKTAEITDDPSKAKVDLGGLTVAAMEDEGPVFASEEKVAVTPPGISEELMHKLKDEYPGDKSKAYATAWKIHNQSSLVTAAAYIVAAAKEANAQGGSWYVDGGEPVDVTENGGRTPEIGEAHSKLEDNTGISRPATVKPIKLAAEMSSGKAVKEAEKLGEDLKAMYLNAKSINSVNDSRPVREAVESIFRAAKQMEEAVSVLNKQQMQEQAEEEAAKIKSEQKKKSSAFGGLAIAAGE